MIKKIIRTNIFCVIFLSIMLAYFRFLPFSNSFIAKANEVLPEITIQSRTGDDSIHRGQAFTVDIVISNNVSGLTALFLTLKKYNKTVFTLIDIESGSALSNLTFDHSNKDTSAGYSFVDQNTGGFNLIWVGEESDNTNGVIATLTFESNIEAKIGDYSIEFTYQANNTRKQYGEEIGVIIHNSTVTLTTGEFTVCYIDYDGAILYQKDCYVDVIPDYVGNLPTREETAEYKYEFSHWENVVSTLKNVITKQAVYTSTPQKYWITFKVNYDDSQGFVFYESVEYSFGEDVDLSNIPTLENHKFIGWFSNETCTTKYNAPFMPSNNLTLFGYFTINIRTENVPNIKLYHNRTEGNIAYVDAYLVSNSGINGMRLITVYDKETLTLVGYEPGNILNSMNFSHTYATKESDYGVDNFKFLWEGSTNSTETGIFITLKFKVKEDSNDGNYNVTFLYDEATFIESDHSIWYTELIISSANVPIGLRHHWNEFVDIESEIDFDITTADGKPYNVELVVKDITTSTKRTLGNDYIVNVIGENRKISSVYSSKFSLNDSDYDANTTINIKIKLTDDQQEYKILYLYYLDDNGEMKEYSSEVKNGYLVFSATTMLDWIIVCDRLSLTDGIIGNNTFMLILLPTVLSIATMGTFLIYWGKKRKIKS